jgi:hypothetical protein
MEAKTILGLIKNDIAHIEEITDEFTLEMLPSPDEVELSLVRVRALLRELELLHKFAVLHENGPKVTNPDEESKVEVPQDFHSGQEPFELFGGEANNNDQEVAMISGQEDLIPSEEVSNSGLPIDDQQSIEEPIDISIINPHVNEGIDAGADLCVSPDIKEVESVNLIANEDVGADLCASPFSEPEIPVTEETADAETLIVPDIQDQKKEILAEEFTEAKKTLNETLGKPQQMGDDILSSGKSEPVYPVMPINSIWDGIGINDRFLYIRELFANSSAKFETTINTLDKLSTIQDAVNYLKINFKWAKTDASQKFLVLVKRRFVK